MFDKFLDELVNIAAKRAAEETIEKLIADGKIKVLPEKEENNNLITSKKACAMLGISRSSLWRWEKTGYLRPIEIGGKRVYRESDIISIINQKN